MVDLAIYYRMVGGFAALGNTQLARLRWALTMGVYMLILSAVHHEGPVQMLIVFAACFCTTFLGRLISHSRFQAVASITNSIGMAVINLIRLALIVAPYVFGSWLTLSAFHFDRMFLPLFGLFAGVAYCVGNKYLAGKDSGIYYRSTHSQYQIASTMANDPTVLDHAAIGGAEWGELLTGFLCYEAMFIAALVMP